MITAGPPARARLAAVDQLATAGVASPAHDAAALLSFVLGTQPALLPMADDLTEFQAQRYSALVLRRAAREPLQHILGTAGFFGLELEVGPGVFIPRPETELLVEHALAAISGVPEPRVADLCSGSGAIALAIAARRPSARVVAVEQSTDALPWLRRNVTRLAPGVRVVHGDVRESLPADTDSAGWSDGTVDLVTCNPPYVPAISTVDPEVELHDPAAAVFAGVDGLDLVRPLVARIAALLRPGGIVLLEHDQSHQCDVLALFRSSGHYGDVEGLKDLTGRPRFLRARRAG